MQQSSLANPSDLSCLPMSASARAGCCRWRALHAGCVCVCAALPRPLAAQLWVPRGVPHAGGCSQRVPLCSVLSRAGQGRQHVAAERCAGRSGTGPGRGKLRFTGCGVPGRAVLATHGHHRVLKGSRERARDPTSPPRQQRCIF